MDTNANPVHNVTCDACGLQFAISPQATAVDGGELLYFDCPHCARRYEYVFITRRGVELRRRLHEIDRLRKTHDSEALRRKRTETLAAYQAEVHSRLVSA